LTFLERIARAAARHAPAELAAEVEAPTPRPASSPRPKRERNPEPPPGHRRRKRSSSSSSPSSATAIAEVAEDDAPCPAWILRRARGEELEGDPQGGGAAPAWPADVLPLVELLELGEVEAPAVPFKLQPWVTITGPRWLEDIRREVAAGTRSPRARTGAIQEDLRFLALRLRGDATAEELEGARRGPSFG